MPNYDPGQIQRDEIAEYETKELILIRHGESLWNEVFNRGIDIYFPLRFLHAICKELVLFVTSDSCFFDSPLSSRGISQASELRGYLINNESTPSDRKYIDILNNKDGVYSDNSVVLTSPLRRCIETLTLALFDRLHKQNTTMFVSSSLQEMTRNVDGVSICGERELPPVSLSLRSVADEFLVDWEVWFKTHFDVQDKQGYKSTEARGDDRIKKFFSRLFSDERFTNKKYVIISGHSLYFKMLFKGYLPKASTCLGKNCKMKNGGVVALQLSKIMTKLGQTRFKIHPDSVKVVFKGFEEAKFKRKKIE